MEHPRPALPPSKRSRKVPKLTVEEQEPSITSTRQEMAAFVESLARGQICSPAWSCTNLLALPTPAAPPAPSLLGPPYSGPSATPSITVSHLTGSPTSPKPRLTFTLDLPAFNTPASISHLDFSPCGCYLLAVTTSLAEDVLTVFEQRDGCINNWAICWSERVERFGEDAAAGSNAKRFVGLRWIGEPRNWFPAPESTDGTPSKRPIFCAPPRSPPVVGAAFIVILSSSELLFVHLPRNTPLLPLTVVLPLHPPPPHLELTLSALPTAPTYSASSATTLPDASPQTAIDALVANLVDGMPSNGPSPSVVAGALGIGNIEGATGGDALKEELRAAEAGMNASKLGMKRRITRGAVGVARAQKAPELGETLFLIATTSKSVSSSPRVATPTPRPPPTKVAEAPAATMLDLTSASSPDDFSNEFTDFSALDEAFGGPSIPPPKPLEPSAEIAAGTAEGARQGDEDQEKRVDLCELRVQMNAMEGPRLMIRPLPPVHLSDPMDANNSNASGELTHLEWLEDIELPRSDSTDSQTSVDLRLLAVSASALDDGALPSSSMSSWAFSNEPVLLSEAFGRLESKKGDATIGAREWTARRAASTSFEGLVPFVHPRAGPTFASFGVGETKQVKDGSISTKVLWLSSSTLEPLASLGETQLPGSAIFSGVAYSANRGLVCATPFSEQPSARPVLAAAPLAASSSDLPSTLASRLVLALARQLDSSDLIGRVIGLKDDAQTLAIVRRVRDMLQGILPPPRQLENSALMLELLGLTTTLYCASPTLFLRGSIAADIIKLATLVRAFRRCEKKERGAPPTDTGYRCESDAVWPLIGHATWYCDFARELAKECGTSSLLVGDSSASPRQILLIHPFVRALHLQALECILGLQAFLSAFPLHQNFVVDTAKTILDDTIDFNGLVLTEWKTVLSRVGELEGVTGDSPELRDLLITFSLTPPLSNASSFLSALLASPTLFLPPSLPTPPPESASSLPLDIIKRNRLAEKGDFKVCLRCGERSEKRVLLGNETGRWTAFEVGWEGRCACGGAWLEEVKM